MALRCLLVSMLALSSCGALHFDVSQDLPEQRVPGSPLGGILPSFIPNPIPLNVDLQAETQKRNTGPASHVYLKSLELKITPHDMPSGNFDFLQQVTIYVEAKDGSLPKKAIAVLTDIPPGSTTVDFSVIGGVDLLPYVQAGALITADASGTQPKMDVTYDGQIVLTIEV